MRSWLYRARYATVDGSACSASWTNDTYQLWDDLVALDAVIKGTASYSSSFPSILLFRATSRIVMGISQRGILRTTLVTVVHGETVHVDSDSTEYHRTVRVPTAQSQQLANLTVNVGLSEPHQPWPHPTLWVTLRRCSSSHPSPGRDIRAVDGYLL